MIQGDAIATRSALYIFLGMFIGGGVVIDGRLYQGEQLNAGAIGSMPTSGPDAAGRPQQLIHRASGLALEAALSAAGLDATEEILGTPTPAGDAVFDAWLEAAVPDVARAATAALSVIDFQTVVVDGVFNPGWRARFVARLEARMAEFNRAGIAPAPVRAGAIGPSARVLGAAALPLSARFSPTPDLLVRAAPAAPQAVQPARQHA